MRLLYRLVRPLARIALKIYFKKIYLSGLENMPKDKPIILAANHPTAFLEPCLLACLLPQPLYFMVRGDFFQKPVFRILLESLQMIPIYRMKDIGIKGVKNNFSSLDVVHDLLKENKTILILAEGTTKHEKRLRPIQKGAARMALGAIEKYPELDVQIVPLGVNYSDVLSFRSFVMLDVGKPISVQTYLKASHPAKIIKEITLDLEEQLKQQVIRIEQVVDEPLIEPLLELYRPLHDTMLPIQSTSRQPLANEIRIATTVGQMESNQKADLAKQLTAYFNKLQKLQIRNAALESNKKPTFVNYFVLVLGYIPYLLGYFFNFLPLFFGKWWADNKVKEIVFYASIKASLALAAYILYALVLVSVAIYLRQSWFWLLLLAIPLLGYFSLYYYEYKERWKQQRQIAKTDIFIIESLKKEKLNIQTQIQNSVIRPL